MKHLKLFEQFDDPFGEEIVHDPMKFKLIEYIREMVKEYGSSDMIPQIKFYDNPIPYKEDLGNRNHFIVRCTEGRVIINLYKDNQNVGAYKIEYEDLEIEYLKKIKNRLDEIFKTI